jgi:hypothetical protein
VLELPLGSDVVDEVGRVVHAKAHFRWVFKVA